MNDEITGLFIFIVLFQSYKNLWSMKYLAIIFTEFIRIYKCSFNSAYQEEFQ